MSDADKKVWEDKGRLFAILDMIIYDHQKGRTMSDGLYSQAIDALRDCKSNIPPWSNIDQLLTCSWNPTILF